MRPGRAGGSTSGGANGSLATAVDVTQASSPVAAPSGAPVAQPGGANEDLPGVTSQLVRVLSPPRPVATGTYTVKVSLHPESLGVVHATVTAGDTRLAVHLVAGTNDAELAIRQSLSELHEALSSGGQQATVTVSGSRSPGTGLGQRSAGTFTAAGMYGGSSGSGGSGGSGGRGATGSRQGTRPLAGADQVTAGAPVLSAVPNGRAPGGRLVDIRV